MVSKKQILEELERVNSRMGQLEQTCRMQAERCDEKIGKLEEQDAQLGQKYGEEICKLEERLGQKYREETSRLEEQADQKYGGGIDKLEAAVFQLEASVAAIRQEISRGEMDQDSKKAAMLYAYRYLLDREPERPEIVEGNQLGWKELRANFMNSPEYKSLQSYDMVQQYEGPYFSLNVEGITYFYERQDKVIPHYMMGSGRNWSGDDIDNFIGLADRVYYQGKAPQSGIFLDIGGNIGTTSIYCKMKLKKAFRFIAFEPYSICAKLLRCNAGINGIGPEFQVEQIALSDQVREKAALRVNSMENQGGNSLITGSKDDTDEIVATTTLDQYLKEHNIAQSEIKYIWIDVEGHEYEVLKGSRSLYQSHKIPTCIEFNQDRYHASGNYEEMIAMLEEYFDSFAISAQVTEGNETFRPISEVKLLWEELNHEPCDLILL